MKVSKFDLEQIFALGTHYVSTVKRRQKPLKVSLKSLSRNLTKKAHFFSFLLWIFR